MYALGFLCKGDGLLEEAEGWYRQAAEGGDEDAMYALGTCSTSTRRHGGS